MCDGHRNERRHRRFHAGRSPAAVTLASGEVRHAQARQRSEPRAQEKGSFDLRVFGIAKDGSVLRAKVTGDRDPGYGSTAKMLGEATAWLALDVPKTALSGGFWTPATALGDRLLARLTAHASLTFEMLD